MNLPQEIAVRSESILPFSDGSAGRAHTPLAASKGAGGARRCLCAPYRPSPPASGRRTARTARALGSAAAPAASAPAGCLSGCSPPRRCPAGPAGRGQSRRTRWRGREASGGPDSALPSSPARLLTPACAALATVLRFPFTFAGVYSLAEGRVSPNLSREEGATRCVLTKTEAPFASPQPLPPGPSMADPLGPGRAAARALGSLATGTAAAAKHQHSGVPWAFANSPREEC